MTRRRIPARERAAIFAAADGRCHVCGEKIDGGRERWDVEHVIAVEMGGDEALGSKNLQPAHVSCHRAKTKRDAGHIAKAKRMQQRESGIPRNPGPQSDLKSYPPTKRYPRGRVEDRRTRKVVWPR